MLRPSHVPLRCDAPSTDRTAPLAPPPEPPPAVAQAATDPAERVQPTPDIRHA